MTAAPLMGNDLQTIADSLPVQSPAPGATQLQIPQVAGADVEILGADYEQLINRNGEVSSVLCDTPVKVSFRVSRDGQQVNSKDYELMLRPTAEQGKGNAKPQIVPELLQWVGGEGTFALGEEVTLRCTDAKLAEQVAADLREVTGKPVRIVTGEADISLETTQNDTDAEQYTLEVTNKGIRISASARAGVYWGSRSLLQMLRIGNNTVPCGTAVDIPRYSLRGFMLDIARTPYPMEYIRDVIRTMSYFKMNDLHLVINNNYIFHEDYVDAGRDPFRESYSAFRLESDVVGEDGTPLTARDLFYTKKEFIELINFAKEHHVNIVPEFDTPGHALSFTRVRPDLIYQGPMNHAKRRCEMLDAGNPEAVKFVTGVLDEYLLKNDKLGQAVLGDCPVVHVGADEFFGEKEDYRKFADGLLTHVLERGYTPRIWGSLSKKPGKTPVVAKGVQMNLWSSGWMKASEAVAAGYDVINTNDGALYIVPFADYYRMDKCHAWLYDNWYPNKVDAELLPAGHPQLLGATFAVWNDMTGPRHPGYAPYDVWGSISSSIELLSQKMWGKATMPYAYARHLEVAASVGDAPFCNPLYRWASAEPVTITPTLLPQKIDLPALGPDYHLTIELELASAPENQEQVLLSAPEGQLIAVMKDGTVGFRRNDAMEFSFGAKLPVGKKVRLELIGTPGKTRLLIDGQESGQMVLNTHPDAKAGFTKRTRDLQSTFVLPLEVVGESLLGKVYSMTVIPSAEK